MKLIKHHTYLKSLLLVCGTGLAIFIACLAIFTQARGLLLTPVCDLKHQIQAASDYNNLAEWQGKWYMQGSNAWFMNGFIDLQAVSQLRNNELLLEWKGFYSYFLMPSKFATRIKTEGVNLSWDIIQPSLVKDLIHSEPHPFHVLAYEKDNYVVLFDCGGTWMPEGGLFALTRQNNNSEIHSIVNKLSTKHHIDSLFYSAIPHYESGLATYLQLISQNAWRVFLTLNILLILLCHLMPLHVTMLNSFSYTTLIRWNFGTHYFNIQTILMYAYHQSFLAKLSHATVLSDLLLWYTVISTNAKFFFGPITAALVLAGVIAFQVSQLLSFRDNKFMMITAPIYVAFASFAFFYMEQYYYHSCAIIIITGMLRVVGHAPEPIPPILSGNDSFIGLDKIPFSRKLCVPIYMAVGVISESSVGMPYRGFPFIFYLVLCRFGFTSRNLISLKECNAIDQAVKKSGWEGSPLVMKAMEGEHGWLFD